MTTTSEDTMSMQPVAMVAADRLDKAERERDQARDLACEYASRLAYVEAENRHIAELLGSALGAETVLGGADAEDVRTARELALCLAQGAAVEVPLRVLVEWALRGHGWEQEFVQLGDMRVLLWTRPDDDSVFGGRQLASAVSVQIEREEAAPAAETRDA
jgi:hypothetical protein